MNKSLQNTLAAALILAIAVLSYSALQYVKSYDKSIQPSSFRSFWVSGDSKASVVPDVAQFTFSVISEGKGDIGKLQAANTEKMNKAIEFIKSKKIDSKDVSTQNYQIDPRYNYKPCTSSVCPPPEISGYSITQTVSVKIRNFENISDVLTKVVEAGANSVSQLSFIIDDPTEVQKKIRAKAIDRANKKAQDLAEEAGFKLGRLLEIQESAPMLPMATNYNQGMGYAKTMDAMAPQPVIEPGSQEVSTSIQLRYEIE